MLIFFMYMHWLSHAGSYLCIDMPNNATISENTDVSDYLTTDRCKTEDDTLDKDATNKITSDIPSGIHKLRNKTDNPGTNISSSHIYTASGKTNMYVHIYVQYMYLTTYVLTHVCTYNKRMLKN